MAAKQAFGRTWWGNAWVAALERIDYDANRLPRGRSYARNGSVRAIEIRDGEVFAKVRGSRPKPYDVRIKLRQWNNAEAEKIRHILSEHPAVSAQLGLGRLPESVMELFINNKLDIFPKSWQDVAASCSCPDWANPCKHLAAVYYIVANEIDKDPFIVFNLKGLKQEYVIDGMGAAELAEAGSVAPPKEIFAQWSHANFVGAESSGELPDLSFSRYDVESVFSLLQADPLFYPGGDFRKTLLQAYKGVILYAENIGINEDPSLPFIKSAFNLVYKGPERLFFASPPASLPSGRIKTLSLPSVSDKAISVNKVKGEEIACTGDVLDLFLPLSLDAAADGTASARFLNMAVSTAIAFVRAAGFVPEVVNRDNGFCIRYIPVCYDEKTEAAINCLSAVFPAGFCFRNEDMAVMTPDGIPDILSLFITGIVGKHAQSEMMSGRDKIHSAFFLGKEYTAERFEEKQTGKSVSAWLERLHIRRRDISPVIRIEAPAEEFSLEIEVENRKDPIAPLLPLSKVFDSKGKIFDCPVSEVRNDVSRQIGIAGEHVPQLMRILNSRGKDIAFMNPTEMGEFMTRTSAVLDLLGIKTMLPKELARLATVRLAVKAVTKGKGETVSYLSLGDLLDFSWEIAIGDKTVSKEEFKRLAKSAGGVVKFRDGYVMLRPEDARNILERLSSPAPRMSAMDALRAAFIGEADGMLFKPDAALEKILNDITRVEDVRVPETLNARLRPYQERGFRWLYSNTVKGFGSCIADDMGLGKTIQIITLILKMKEEERLSAPVLVVCPTTLVGNWQKECERFAPSLAVSIFYGSERRLEVKGKDIVITTYGILRRDLEKFRGREWGLMVIDEAQNIKNPETDQTKAVKSVKAGGCIAMSGTPVENRLSELWSIFDFINRGYLGGLGGFRTGYALPIEKYRDREKVEQLRKATVPFMLRRLKSDKTIISDLPDKLMFDEYCYLSKEQTALYQKVVDETMKEIELSDGIERKGLIFKLITFLKQICNHPVHFSKKGEPIKALSGKAEKTIDLIGNIISAREKALIFTQYREMGEILAGMIKNELGETAPFFHGGIPRAKRDRMVAEFQNDMKVRLMIISLKTGGTGLNLTAASNVIHYDLWWNPAVEAQATDRAYRIGQEKNVTVHRLITIGTFEEKIDEMIKSKKELADLTVSTGEQWITELSNGELKEIFGMGRQALCREK